ncbi:helix-turn-helix transcriptional regulator [Thalassobellus citreus]|uniref:helix-turn-helix transcriptional regulator n=1 Tax=Thalassobellus citreus TaxID=3367752 RepID=UPI00379B98DC
MQKNSYSLKILFSSFFAIILCFSGFSQKNKNYHRFVDSAEVYIDTNSKIASNFLNSIPKPIEEAIEGRIADYYAIKALVHDDRHEEADKYQSNLLAYKYAKEEKNYSVAATSCLELFTRVYFAKKDTIAYKYLDKAEEYFILANDSLGLLEVEQMHAYTLFLDYNYDACNKMLIKHLDTYKNAKEDAYYYMFATFMLSVNYIDLDSLNKAKKYFKEFKSLEKDSTIIKYNYLAFKVGIDVPLAENYFKKKQLDSTFYYLSEAAKLRNYMDVNLVKNYLNLSINAYKISGNIDKARAYVDSLLVFEEKMMNNIVNADHKLNDLLIKAESELEVENIKKYFNGALAVILFFALSFLCVLFINNKKKVKFKLKKVRNQESNLSYLKSNNEKLTVKVQGLEEYIVNLKKEVKTIAAINDPLSLRESIKGFYKNLHLNSSTLLDKTESHLELVNDLNIEFFKKINEFYPQLNNSEVIICYYLFIGFKNKEIAVFLNTTVRAIESKRYRITKKINLENTTLIKHLEATF